MKLDPSDFINVLNVDSHSAVIELSDEFKLSGDNGSIELGVRAIGTMQDESSSPKTDKINWQRFGDNFSTKKRTVTLTHLQPNLEYFVRLAGNNDSTKTFWTADWLDSEKEEPTVINDRDIAPHYFVGRRLGRGHFGDVNLCSDNNNNNNNDNDELAKKNNCSFFSRVYAVKSVKVLRKQQIEAAQNEIAILRELRHENIVWLKQAIWTKSTLYLVMEYVAGGELFEKISGDDYVLTELDCACYLRQICRALSYFHAKNIVHLDLKVENIMLANPVRRQIKIIDFGIARQLQPKVPCKVMCGTAEFCAPEVLLYDPILTLTDMWSVGVIAYIMLSGLSPFLGDNDAETHANVVAGEYTFEDPAFDAISEAAKDFITQLIVKNKEQRLTAEKCLAHEWLMAASVIDSLLPLEVSITIDADLLEKAGSEFGSTLSLNGGANDSNAMFSRRLSVATIDTTKLRAYWARRKWKKACGVLRAVQRISFSWTHRATTSSPTGVSSFETPPISKESSITEQDDHKEASPSKQENAVITTP